MSAPRVVAAPFGARRLRDNNSLRRHAPKTSVTTHPPIRAPRDAP